MIAVLKREFKSYFQSPIGYIFSGVFFAICSLFFISGTLYYQSADLKSIFANVNVIYLFLVSLLTMGLFANERSRRTDQLLLTAPISLYQIVIGKFLAAMSVFGVTLVLSLLYPIVISIFGNPSYSELVGAYLGFILLWGTFIAIGMFISALTESQIIAAVVNFGVLLVVYYMDYFGANITSPVLQKIIIWFSVMDRYNDFQRGILNIENIVYYLSIIAIFIMLTAAVIDRRRYSDKKLLLNRTIVTAAFVAGTILFNAIIGAFAAKLPMQFDMTRDKVYEFSDQTKDVLAGIDEPISIYAMYPDSTTGELYEAIKEHLNLYQTKNGNIKVTYIDPYTDPAFARNYGEDVGVGSVVVEKGDRFKVIPLSQLYRQSQYTGEVSIDAENQLTSAISYVCGSFAQQKAYFIEGHNEYPSSELKTALEAQGFEAASLQLSTTEIPDDASILISMLPTADFTETERNALDKYLLNGGNAAFVFNAGFAQSPRLIEYLAEWGIAPNADYVIEDEGSMLLRSDYGLPVPAPKMQEHAITSKLLNRNIPIMMPDSCSFSINKSNIQHTLVTPLLLTSDRSWGITDLTRSTTAKQEGDLEGPLTLAALAEKSDGRGGKVFVFGSIRGVETTEILKASSYSNGDFIINALSYLAGNNEALGIRAKVISSDTLAMTENQIALISFIMQYIIPLAILITGLCVWLKRRYL